MTCMKIITTEGYAHFHPEFLLTRAQQMPKDSCTPLSITKRKFVAAINQIPSICYAVAKHARQQSEATF